MAGIGGRRTAAHGEVDRGAAYPVQYMKPYVKRQKNNMADAGAIAKAASWPTARSSESLRGARPRPSKAGRACGGQCAARDGADRQALSQQIMNLHDHPQCGHLARAS